MSVMQSNFLRLTRTSTQSVVLLFSALQLCFQFSADNLVCVLLSLFGWFITNNYLFTEENFSKFTLSSVVILGFSITQFLFPIVFTFIDGHALINNLDYPFDVFLHSLLALIILITTHKFYKQSSLNNKFKRKNKWQRILLRVKLFSIPTEKQMWIMGFVGQVATIFQMFFSSPSVSGGAGDGGSIAFKFLEGFAVFSAAPFFVVLKRMYGNYDDKPIKKFAIKITAYTLLQVLVGIISNSRGAFMGHLTALGICYFISLLMGKYSVKKISAFKVILFFVLLSLILPPLTDLSIAMVSVRGERKDLKGIELISATIDAYKDKNRIKAWKVLIQSDEILDYSEAYLNSIFLSRFCNLKFNDNAFASYHKIGKVDEAVQLYAYERIIAIFPQPFLNFFGVKLDKSFYTSTSFGDFLFYRAGGANALGGLRTGHFAGTGMATFGWWYLLVLAILVPPLFFLFDLLTIINRSENNLENQDSASAVSLAGLISITLMFTFFANSTPAESITSIIPFVIRGWLQLVLLYIILFKVTKLV